MAKDKARDLVEKLPDPLKGMAQQKVGRRRRPWWVIAGAMVAAGAGLVFFVRRARAPGYEEEPLLGETQSYPSTGSGTGWPEPQRTPEHTETLTSANGVSAPPVIETPHIAAGGEPSMEDEEEESPAPQVTPFPSAGARQPETFAATGAAEPEAGTLAARSASALSAAAEGAPVTEPEAQAHRDADATRPYEQTLRFPATPDSEPGTRPSDDPTVLREIARDEGVPFVRSEPAQRPEIPFSERQAEINARLQLQQDALYAAFPGMTRHDIVECDGDLDRLTVILASRLGNPVANVRDRLDTILGTGPVQHEGPGIEPNLHIPRD
jgi:hypothetical protein